MSGGRELEKRQGETRDLLLQREDLELHLSQLREDIGGRQGGRRSSRGGKGRREVTTMGISYLLDLGEAQTFLACIIGMRDGCQTRLMQPQTEGFGIDAQDGTDVRERKKIHDDCSFHESRWAWWPGKPNR